MHEYGKQQLHWLLHFWIYCRHRLPSTPPSSIRGWEWDYPQSHTNWVTELRVSSLTLLPAQYPHSQAVKRMYLLQARQCSYLELYRKYHSRDIFFFLPNLKDRLIIKGRSYLEKVYKDVVYGEILTFFKDSFFLK